MGCHPPNPDPDPHQTCGVILTFEQLNFTTGIMREYANRYPAFKTKVEKILRVIAVIENYTPNVCGFVTINNPLMESDCWESHGKSKQ